jgi:hypothetical protein
MADTKISAAAGETGGPTEPATLTTNFLRQDGLYITPFSCVPSTVPVTPTGQVASYSATGGDVTSAGGGLHATLNAQGLTTLQGGVVPGSVIVAASTVANTTTETQLVGLTVPANDAVAGAIYLIKASGVYSDTGTPTLAFGLRWGGAAGVSIATTAATTLGSGVSNEYWQAEALIQIWTATTAMGYLNVDLGTSTSTNATTRLTGTTGASAATVAVTTQKVLSLTVTFSAASSSNTISATTAYGMRLA